MTDRPEADSPVVSVVIPVLNGETLLGGCLDSLLQQRDAPPFEVLVVDNGSTDATVAVASRHPVKPRLLAEPAPGAYAARNAGLQTARGSIVALTDADCVVSPGWLAAGAEAISAGADLVAGAIHLPASGTRPSIWERYDRATNLRQEHHVETGRFAAAGNMFVRASVFERIGRFKPEFLQSGDVEFGRRATAAGFSLVFSGGASVTHAARTSFRGTWALHRKIGSGFAELNRAGLWDPPWRDQSLRIPLGTVAELVALDGPRIRRRYLAPVHLLAMGARLFGSLTGRP